LSVYSTVELSERIVYDNIIMAFVWSSLRLDANQLDTSYSQRLNSGKLLGTMIGGIQLNRAPTGRSPLFVVEFWFQERLK